MAERKRGVVRLGGWLSGRVLRCTRDAGGGGGLLAAGVSGYEL